MSMFVSLNLQHKPEEQEFYQYGDVYEIKGRELIEDESLQDAIIKGYAEEGSRFFNRLRGEFAICFFYENHWVLVNDALGVVPLYYYMDHNHIFVGTWINEFVFLKLTADREHLKQIYHDDYSSQSSTVFKELRKLRQGHCIKVSGDTFEQSQYYSPRPVNHSKKSTPELIEELDKLVLTSLARRSKLKQSVLLSGGLDSSLLCKMMSKLKLKFTSFSMVFSHDDSANEKWCLDEVLEDASWKHNVYEWQECRQQMHEETNDLHFYTPTLSLFKPLLKQAADRNSEVMISGLGGDDLFSSGDYVLSELLRRRDYKLFAGEFKRQSGSLGHKIKQSIVPLFEMRWATQLILYFVKMKPLNKTFRRLQQRKARWDFSKNLVSQTLYNRLFLSGIYSQVLETEQQQAQSCGIRMSYPLLDLDVVEWAMGLQPKYLSWDGEDKVILRQVAKQYLSKSHSNHRSEQDYSNVVKTLMKEQQHNIGTKVLEGELVEKNVINKRNILNWITDPINNVQVDEVLKINHYEKILKFTEADVEPRTKNPDL